MKAMRMGVLGPLVMERGGRSHVPRAQKPRQLLALLMINAEQPVGAGDCLNELWDTNPPRSAMSTLQTYVLHLRRTMGEVADDRDDRTLRTANHAYQLAVNRLDIDCFRFEDLTRRGGACARAGDHLRASALFTEALDLWRGPALADVRLGPLTLPYVVELEETRKCVLEQRIEADLRLDRHLDLIDELDVLTTANPANENLHAQFMVALYRSGRRQQALTVYRKLCRNLEENFGFEPDARMRRLYEAIWSGHPGLGVPTPTR